MDNIILIGMPGSGKSTLGVVLAKILNYGFVDSDLLIQSREGKKLYELIDDYGLEGFLKIEDQVNRHISGRQTVIATGGSAVYNPASMEYLKSTGIVVYLRVSCAALKKRLGDLDRRGVVIDAGQTLKDLYEERRPYYEKYADITVDLDGLSMEEALEKLVYEIESYEES